MLPVIAIVGCPNVGKSTLFNRLTGTRDALVADYPGLTRDRLYGFANAAAGPAIVVDTGGLTGAAEALDRAMQRQVAQAVEESDAVIMLVDGAAGPSAGDTDVAALLRRSGKPVILAVNKSEGVEPQAAVADFHGLGLGDPLAISASRGERIAALMETVLAHCPPAERAAAETTASDDAIRIAIVGRPNVGKSTLINRYLGEERVVTLDEAGTTRDSIEIPFEADGRHYVLIDTAGIRRKARVTEVIEKISVVKSLKALDDADAVIVLCDARDGITEQDVSLIGLVLERGRALALGVNKWDGLTAAQRAEIRGELDRRLPFLDFVDTHFVSAKHGSNIYDLLTSASRAAAAARRDLPTRRLNEVLQAAVQAHPPPILRRRRIKLSYAHQGGRRPPLIVVHGNQAERLPGSYRRYLVRRFRKEFRLKGTPVRLELRSGDNPFAGRRNRPGQGRKPRRGGSRTRPQ